MKSMETLVDTWRLRKTRFAERDQRNEVLSHVMLGRFQAAFPAHFRPGVRPLAANALAVAAFDFADLLAPLPTIEVPPDTDKNPAQKRADKRARIAVTGYWEDWRWKLQMLQGALWYMTFGYLPVCVWPYSRTLDKYAPYATLNDPCGFYPGPIEAYGEQPIDGFVSWRKSAGELAMLYPGVGPYLVTRRYGRSMALETNDIVECVRYHGPGEVTTFLPDCNVTLTRMSLPADLKRPTLLMACRPGISPETMQGQFDQLVGVMLGKARLTQLVLTYAERQVHAPIEIDEDANWKIGADAVIRRPRGAPAAQKVGINMPADVWRELDTFERELRLGSRRPSQRDGEPGVSYATGKGIDALQSGIDSQLQTGQTILGALQEELLSTALALDEAYYPNRERPIGLTSETYIPSEDIQGRYRVKATYGLMSGVNPSYAMVMLSQATAARFASRKTAMEQLPMIPGLAKELDRIRHEQGEDALLAYVQAAAASGDPMALKIAMQLAPDSPFARAIEKMQTEAAAQQPAPVPGAQGGPAVGAAGPPGANPAEQAESAAYQVQQGGSPQDLEALLGPLLMQMQGAG